MSHWRSSPCDARAQLPQSRTGRTRLRLVASNYRPEKIVFCESIETTAATNLQRCRWCFLPAATHGGADKCPSRQYPSVEKPLPPAGGPARTKGSTAKNDYSKRYNSELRVLQREADAKLVLFERQGTLPAVPSGAILKEEGTFVKEEGVPPMPPDAFVIKEEVVVKEEEESDVRPKRQRTR